MSAKDKLSAASKHVTGRRDFLIRAGFTAGAVAAFPTAGLASTKLRDHGTMAGQATAVPFLDYSKEPPRQRKSFYDWTDAEVQQLCAAVGYMRNGTKANPLSVDSPLQWDNWVLSHARHCTESKPGSDQVHWSWFFLPWHRAYLWFLERQLANVITTILGQDGSKFALPYWDWITHKEIPNTAQRTLKAQPSPFFGYDLSQEDMVNADALSFDNLALYDGYRKPTVQQPTMDPANEKAQDSKEHIEQLVNYTSPASVGFMLMLEFEDFAGKAVPPASPIPTPDGMGILEHYPHNYGHDWIGTRYGKNRDMGTLRYAALDPMFFMHHANIDRVWSLYRRDQPDPDKPWGRNGYVWGQQHYTFIDVDGSSVDVSVKDIVKSMTNVTYVAPQTTSVSFPTAPARPGRTRAMSLSARANTLTALPLTIQAQANPQLRAMLATGAAGEERPVSLLVIETGAIPYTGKFTIHVFVDAPDADETTSTHDPHFVGSIRVLDSAARADEQGTNVTHTFSILILPTDDRFYSLVKPGTNFSVTLVPKGVRASDESFRVPVRQIYLKVLQNALE